MPSQPYYRTALWKQIKTAYLRRNPYCYCCGAQATIVHHENYTAHNLSGLDEEFLYPLCNRCHYIVHFNNGQKVKSLEVARRLRHRRHKHFLNKENKI